MQVTGAPILVGFNLGAAAAALEAASDQETVASVMTALAGMYGAARVRQPRSAVVTRWGSDPYSRWGAVREVGPGFDVLPPFR